jgi:hypothetical protein
LARIQKHHLGALTDTLLTAHNRLCNCYPACDWGGGVVTRRHVPSQRAWHCPTGSEQTARGCWYPQKDTLRQPRLPPSCTTTSAGSHYSMHYVCLLPNLFCKQRQTCTFDCNVCRCIDALRQLETPEGWAHPAVGLLALQAFLATGNAQQAEVEAAGVQDAVHTEQQHNAS